MTFNHRSIAPVQRAFILLFALMLGLMPGALHAAVVFQGSSSGINTGLPTNGTPGALTLPRPATARPGMVMIVSIAARPSGMTWASPAGGGWTQLSISSEQRNGGVSTAPGGMTLRTYYRIVGLSEPTSYTWTLANPSNTGGTAVGGMLVFSGIDTASNPINGTPSSVLTASGTTFSTAPVTTTVPNTMMISVLSVLSADSFNPPGFITSTACTNSRASPITDVLDRRSPTAANLTGTTIDMSYFTQANAGISCGTTATITTAGAADNGVAHLMALRPSLRDLSLNITRNVPLSPGGTASYSVVATQEGSLSEPGPLAIVNTLPAGLTFTGYSGADWICSNAGQVVTCTKDGALGAGQSATPLVINVRVAPALNGVITFNATVSGTGGDGNSANDTASETYVILPQPYAYYALDEFSNATSFANTTAITSGPALALGSAKAAGNPPPTVGAAFVGTPGTCGAALNPATADSEINTNIDVNAIGASAGTIAFWYAGSAPWADNNARTLFDASVAVAGNAAQDRHFVLAKDTAGRLVFSLRDSAGTVSTATSVSYGFAANTWHHITVSWDLAADRLFIYLDGDIVAIASSTVNLNGVLGDVATLYMGGQRNINVTGVPAAAYTPNTANGYLDEVRIYNRALAPLEVASVYDLVHACAATVDHYELIVPSTASACKPLPVVQVYACATAGTANSCSGNLQAGVNGRTVGLSTTAGTLGTTAPAFDLIGQANTTLDYAAGGTASITLTIGSTTNPAPPATSLTPIRCCPNGSSCTVAKSCTIDITACSAKASYFNVVDSHYANNSYDTVGTSHNIYTKLAGWNENVAPAAASTTQTSFKLDVVALKVAGTTETRYVGPGDPIKEVAMQIFDDSEAGAPCNGSATACSTCNKTVIASISSVKFASEDSGYQNDVPVAISGTKAYSRLIARVVDSSTTPTVIACSTNAFSVRPIAADLSSSANASGLPLATTTPVVKAGVPFQLNIITPDDTNYKGTFTFDASKLTAQDPVSDVAQSGGVIGTLLSDSLVANTLSVPLANATYSEVGYLYLAADAYRDQTYTAVDQIGDCITGSTTTVKANGQYGCWIGSKRGQLGRFIPDHFVTTLVPGDGTYTYSGQPFTTVTITAVNASGATTKNYVSTFAKAISLSDANSGDNSSSTSGKLSFGGVAGAPVPANRFAAGVAILNAEATPGGLGAAPVAFTFNNRNTEPLSVRTGSNALQLRATDADLVNSTGNEAGAISPIYSGRVRMSNAYGTAQLPLAVTVAAQYYTGAGWVTNTADAGALGTHLRLPPTVTVGSNTGVGAASGIVTTAGCPSLACESSDFSAGLLNLRMSAPFKPGYGDVILDVPDWLHYPWQSTTAGDPRARATFGIYKGQNRIIYRRERY